MDTLEPPSENPMDEESRQEAGRAAIEAVYNAYAPRVLHLLVQIRDILVVAGLEVEHEPYDMSDDDYRWALDLRRRDLSSGNPGEERISCLVELVESMHNDEELLDGINFRLSITDWADHDFCWIEPYNFTPQVWVSAHDLDAVEARWRLIETADFADILPQRF
jgi:hypothetical protein